MPYPLYCVSTKRPFYDQELQQVCLEVRRRNCGIDGMPILFYAKPINRNLHTIVRLPNGVFAPYTSIRTNLLFFTKGQPTNEVWYYEHPYPAGAKSYNKTKPIRIEEFAPEKKWWGKPDKNGRYSKRKENEQAWRVSIDDIKANNFNLDIKNPHSSDTGPGDVDTLLPEYESLLQQIAETRDKLMAQLEAALLGKDEG